MEHGRDRRDPVRGRGCGRKDARKVPEGLVIPVNVRPTPIASLRPTPAPKPRVSSIKEDKPKKPSKPDDKKNQAKKNQDKKSKDKKSNNKKPNNKKPKPEAIAKAGSPQPGSPTPGPSQPKKPENRSATTAPNPASAPTPTPGVLAQDAANRPDGEAKPGTKSSAGSRTDSLNPPPNEDTSKEPAKKKVSTNLFKKKPAYNPVYPKREAVKKKELLPNPGDTSSSPSTTPSP